MKYEYSNFIPLIILLSVVLLNTSVIAQITVQYEVSISNEVISGVVDWAIDDEGNVYLFGTVNYDEFTLLKVDNAGEIVWQRNHNKPLTFYDGPAYKVVTDQDGNLVVAGSGYDRGPRPGEEPPWEVTAATLTVHKYDTDGNELWGAPLNIDQDLDCGLGICGPIVVDDAGFIYISSSDMSLLAWVTSSNIDTLLCTNVYGITTHGVLAYTERLDNNTVTALLRMPNSALGISEDVELVYCEDEQFPENNWYNVEKNMSILRFTSAGLSGTLFGPWGLHACTIDNCTFMLSNSCTTQPGSAALGGPLGSIAVELGVRNYNFDQGYYGDLTFHIGISTPEGELTNVIDPPNRNLGCTIIDNQGNIIVEYGNTMKLSPQGDILWEKAHTAYDMAVDANNYIYQLAQTVIRCLNPDNGDTEWECPVYPVNSFVPNHSLYVDDDKRIHLFRQGIGETHLAVYNTNKQFTILDATAGNDPITNTEFWLINMKNDIPNLTEDTLGKFTTDADGEFELNIVDCGEFEFVHDLYNGSTHDTVLVGDSLKIARRLYSEPAIKHTDVLGTMYSLHLDNAKFDEVGMVTFDTLDNMAKQEFVLNHTEVRYNLTVRVQWEARRDYLEGLEDHFRDLSNYLYDVFDGQLRLDTVRIYDASNPEQWEVADYRIYSSNQKWPSCKPFFNGLLPIKYSDPNGFSSVNLPRWIRGKTDQFAMSTSSLRDFSYTDYPYTMFNSDQFRTFAHEFGHYALGFDEEYEFHPPDAERCEEWPSGNYGFMDNHYERDISGAFSSEMSNEYKYSSAECQKTLQYQFYLMSCWDLFELLYERTYYSIDYVEGIWAPIRKPHYEDKNERLIPVEQRLTGGPNILLGPDVSSLNYHVGSKIVFPDTPEDQRADYSDWAIEVFSGSASLPNIDVTLQNRVGSLIMNRISQGKTALDPPDNKGKIVVLGVGPDDYINASGRSYSTVGNPTAKILTNNSGQWFSGSLDVSQYMEGDTVSFELEPIDGDYPMICAGDLLQEGISYSLLASSSLLVAPTIECYPYDSLESEHVMGAAPGGYQSAIAVELGSYGTFIVHAVDDSLTPYFFDTPYRIVEKADSAALTKISLKAGTAVALIDSANNGLDRALLMSSSYPVPLAGLADTVLQVSDAYSLGLYPDQQLAGDNSISMFYSEEMLTINGSLWDEDDIGIFKWNDLESRWDYVGGTVNPDMDYVITSITMPGVYAAFAADFAVDVEDDEHGDILPYRFELSQNYPNPFNPLTTIEYSLPERGHVIIEIYNVLGQKVRSLVDREETAGSYNITWDGRDVSGRSVATGIYLYRFQAGDHVETKKMLLLK